MQQLIRGFVAAFVLVLASAESAAAQPVGWCPHGFALHEVIHNEAEHRHPHVGTSADQNGDGWICVQHLPDATGIHVHIDNAVRQP
jgi:hypothetical protein